MSEILNLNALCRCCHADGAFRSLQAPYVQDGAIQIYAVLLRDTFGLHINPPTVEASYTICESCIDQLRLAHLFKKQVLACEKKFEEYCKNEQTITRLVDVKIEIDNDNVTINPDVDDDDDDGSDADDSDGGYSDNNSEIEGEIGDNFVQETEDISCRICNENFENVQLKSLHVYKVHVADGLSCKICNRTFRSQKILRCHSKRHENKIWQCNYCVETFLSKRAWNDHEYNQHIKFTGYVCDKCHRSFETRQSLVSHLEWHNHRNRFACETCGRAFKKSHALRVHVETVHENRRQYQCTLCGKAYKAKFALVLHNYTHTGERPFKCGLCAKAFKAKISLKYHMECHELRKGLEETDGDFGYSLGGEDEAGAEDSDGGYDNTGIVNESQAEIEEDKEIEIEIKPEVKTKTVDNPVNNFNSDDIADDLKSEYAESYPDDDNDIKFKDGKNYQAELSVETQLSVNTRSNVTKGRVNRLSCKSDVPTYNCDFCDEQFTSEKKLQDHYTDKHITDDLSCTLCKLPFKRRQDQIKHLILKHSKKNYHCRICLEAYKSQLDLQNHENTHTINDGYICDYCRKIFKWKLTLIRHVNWHMGNFKEFPCNTCARTFRVRANLRRHVAAVHDKLRPYKCDLCDKSFSLRKLLDTHRRFHTGERPFQCDICFKGFVSNDLMRKHRLLKHKEIRKQEGVQCDVCSKHYPSFAIKQHMDCHTKPYKCELCGQGFGQRATLKRHKNNAHSTGDVVEKKQFKCGLCDQVFSQKAVLMRHKKIRHASGQERKEIKTKGKKVTKQSFKKYICDFCDDQVASKSKLQDHFCEKHIPIDLSCTLCNLPFKYQKGLIEHLMTKHEKITFFCQFCTETFNSPNALKDHEGTHTKDGYACDYCHKAFKWKVTLKRHINWHMGNFKLFVCETCGHAFKFEANLRQHVLTVHEKRRPFQCDLCDKNFTQKRILDAHKISHTGETPFVCDVCSKGFVTKSRMLAHRKWRHYKKEGNKGISCDVCGKQLASLYALKIHMGTHTKPFECDLCGQGFSQKSLLLRHKKNKHTEKQTYGCRQNKSMICDICNKTYRDWEKHKRRHDKNPFKCHLCDKFYAEKITLDRHLEKHYKVRKYPCDVCNKMFTRPECVRIHKERKHNSDRDKKKKERKNKRQGAQSSAVKVEANDIDRNFDSVVPAFSIPKLGLVDENNLVTALDNAVLGI